MEKSHIATSELIKTRKDMTKMLDFVDKAFHQMPFPIQPGVILALGFGALMRWDDGLGLLVNDKGDELLGSITTVSNDMLTHQAINQCVRLGNVMMFTARQAKAQRSTQGIHRYMNLGTEPASAAFERLFSLPTIFLSAPAAHGWARMTVLSIMTLSMSASCEKAGTSLPKSRAPPISRSVCTHCSMRRIHSGVNARLLHCGSSTASLPENAVYPL
jgi:hypothetical protein